MRSRGHWVFLGFFIHFYDFCTSLYVCAKWKISGSGWLLDELLWSHSEWKWKVKSPHSVCITQLKDNLAGAVFDLFLLTVWISTVVKQRFMSPVEKPENFKLKLPFHLIQCIILMQVLTRICYKQDWDLWEKKQQNQLATLYFINCKNDNLWTMPYCPVETSCCFSNVLL